MSKSQIHVPSLHQTASLGKWGMGGRLSSKTALILLLQFIWITITTMIAASTTPWKAKRVLANAATNASSGSTFSLQPTWVKGRHDSRMKLERMSRHQIPTHDLYCSDCRESSDGLKSKRFLQSTLTCPFLGSAFGCLFIL